jgi:hypothetical protein
LSVPTRSKKAINAKRRAQGATHSHAKGDKARVDPIPLDVLQKVIDDGRRDDEPDVFCILPPLESNANNLLFKSTTLNVTVAMIDCTLGRESHNPEILNSNQSLGKTSVARNTNSSTTFE